MAMLPCDTLCLCAQIDPNGKIVCMTQAILISKKQTLNNRFFGQWYIGGPLPLSFDGLILRQLVLSPVAAAQFILAKMRGAGGL